MPRQSWRKALMVAAAVMAAGVSSAEAVSDASSVGLRLRRFQLSESSEAVAEAPQQAVQQQAKQEEVQQQAQQQAKQQEVQQEAKQEVQQQAQQQEQQVAKEQEQQVAKEQAKQEVSKADAAEAAKVAQLDQQRADQVAKDPQGAAKQQAAEQLQQEKQDEKEVKDVALPDDLQAFLKPSYEQAVSMALAVDVPGGMSPVDAAKYRIDALRRRLDVVNRQRKALQDRRAAASRRADEAYLRMEELGKDLHHAYNKHEAAARGVDLDHVKGDPATLHAVVQAADRLLQAQEAHFSVTNDFMVNLPLGYDQELSLDNARLRLERAITTLEKQLADSISAAAERDAEKREKEGQ